MSYKDMRASAMQSYAKRQHMYARGGEVSDAAEDRKEVAAGVHRHESHLHKGEPKTKLKDGGAVEGFARGGKTDRPKHGGKTVINIVMPPGGAAGGPPAMPAMPPRPAMPVMPPGAPPPGAGMPPRPMPPVGGLAPMGPPGGPPGGAMVPPMRAKGGRMTAGAGSGEGRIEKAEGKA